MRIPYQEMKDEFERVLLNVSFTEQKAALCARIFANNSLDGVYSHGVNRFPVFIDYVKQGIVKINAEPEVLEQNGIIEKWDGQLGPGMYIATKAMQRAIEISKLNGMGAVVVKNTNHWMRGGTYGRQAADAGCVGICFSNTIANMPAWGGKEARLGNNPLVIAVPRESGHLILDMAMSQFSYGKLQENELKKTKLPVAGGYDENGMLTTDPVAIMKSQRALPIGFWKGSGLSFILDVLLTVLSGGQSTSRITASGQETGLSQFFLCLHQHQYENMLVEQIIENIKSGELVNPDSSILYPGEQTLITRKKNEKEGIPVKKEIWEKIQNIK